MAASDINQALARGHGPVQPAPRPILVSVTVFHAHGRGAVRELRASSYRGRRVLGMAQFAHVDGLYFVFGPTKEPCPSWIDAQEIALEIRNREQIFGDVPDTIALKRPSLDFLFEFLAEDAQFRLDA